VMFAFLLMIQCKIWQSYRRFPVVAVDRSWYAYEGVPHSIPHRNSGKLISICNQLARKLVIAHHIVHVSTPSVDDCFVHGQIRLTGTPQCV